MVKGGGWYASAGLLDQCSSSDNYEWLSELICSIQHWNVASSNASGCSVGEAGRVAMQIKVLNLGGETQPHHEISDNLKVGQYYTE